MAHALLSEIETGCGYTLPPGLRRWLRETLFELFGQITGLIFWATAHVRSRNVTVAERNATCIGGGFRLWWLRKFGRWFFLRRDGVQLSAGLMCVVSDLGRRC